MSEAKVKASPRVIVFAGPNGAGKSTHADAILAKLGIETFVNADFIARGLSGRNTKGNWGQTPINFVDFFFESPICIIQSF